MQCIWISLQYLPQPFLLKHMNLQHRRRSMQTFSFASVPTRRPNLSKSRQAPPSLFQLPARRNRFYRAKSQILDHMTIQEKLCRKLIRVVDRGSSIQVLELQDWKTRSNNGGKYRSAVLYQALHLLTHASDALTQASLSHRHIATTLQLLLPSF